MRSRDHVTEVSDRNRLRPLPAPAGKASSLIPSSNGHGDLEADDTRSGQPARPRKVRVALSISEEVLRKEVVDFLGRCPGVHLDGAASTPDALGRLAEEARSQALVVCPETIDRVPDQLVASASSVLVVTEDLTVRILRQAIRVGAQGVFEWPTDRADLVAGLARIESSGTGTNTARGMVVAVAGARGGAGATFVASHLAGAFAARDRHPILIDADPRHADLTAALGITSDDGARTVEDLVPVVNELSPEHIADALHLHPGGFPVLLGPPDANAKVRPGVYRGVVALLALEYDPVMLHVARADDPSTKAITDLADVIVLVTTLDLFSLYGAKRLIGALGLSDRLERCVVVVNRYGRSSISSKDVHRVLGLAPTVRIRTDRRVRRLQDRGRLLPARSGGAGRDMRRLAGSLLRMEPVSSASGQW